MIKDLVPSIEDQIAELKLAGWIQKTSSIWKCPTGKLFANTHGAWKILKRSGKNGAKCETMTDEETGISIRCIQQWDSGLGEESSFKVLEDSPKP